MSLKLTDIAPSQRHGKRLVASFSNGLKVHFGQSGGSTYIDHKDDKKKENYIARHRVNEDWENPTTAGALARYILWNKPTLSASIKDFKARFGI